MRVALELGKGLGLPLQAFSIFAGWWSILSSSQCLSMLLVIKFYASQVMMGPILYTPVERIPLSCQLLSVNPPTFSDSHGFLFLALPTEPWFQHPCTIMNFLKLGLPQGKAAKQEPANWPLLQLLYLMPPSLLLPLSLPWGCHFLGLNVGLEGRDLFSHLLLPQPSSPRERIFLALLFFCFTTSRFRLPQNLSQKIWEERNSSPGAGSWSFFILFPSWVAITYF